MKFRKNVSNEEIKNSLILTLEKNTIALDYIENVLHRTEDLYKYNEDDEDVKEQLDVLKYIKFSLTYLDKQYNDSLKKLGVFKHGFNK